MDRGKGRCRLEGSLSSRSRRWLGGEEVVRLRGDRGGRPEPTCMSPDEGGGSPSNDGIISARASLLTHLYSARVGRRKRGGRRAPPAFSGQNEGGRGDGRLALKRRGRGHRVGGGGGGGGAIVCDQDARQWLDASVHSARFFGGGPYPDDLTPAYYERRSQASVMMPQRAGPQHQAAQRVSCHVRSSSPVSVSSSRGLEVVQGGSSARWLG